MLTKAKQFIQKPSNLLAVLAAVAVAGIGSMFAMQAFADGDVPAVPDEILSNYSQSVINYVYMQTWDDDVSVQVYCSEAGTESATLTYAGDNNWLDTSEFKKDGASFDLNSYDSDGDGTTDMSYSETTVTINGDLPSKRYYAFQNLYNEETDNYEETYVGSFDIKNSSSLKKILTNGYLPYYDVSDFIKEIGLDTSDAEGTYSPSESVSAYDAKGERVHHTGEYYEWENQGSYFPGGSGQTVLRDAGFDFTSATYSFLGIKEKTFYKYGDRVPLESSHHSATNVPIITPNGANPGSQSYIAVLHDSDNDSDIVNYGTLKPISSQSLSSLLGIPGDAGTIMTYANDSSMMYVPVTVYVDYSVVSPDPKVMVRNTELNGHSENVFDNTDECLLDGLYVSMKFQPESGYPTPQSYSGTEYASAEAVPDDEWEDAVCWESSNDKSKTFPLGSQSTVKGLFTASNYSCGSSGGVIKLRVPVNAQFPIPMTYTLQYDLNKPKDTLVVTNESAFVEVGNIEKEAVENGDYKLTTAKPKITGYTFKGWTLNGGGAYDSSTGVPFSCFDNEAATAVATASWEINKHKVTYWIYGRKPAAYTKPSDQNAVVFDTEVTVAEKPSYDGYSFTGWTVFGATPENGKFNMPDNDVEIYGTFTEFQYNLVYNANVPEGETVGNMPGNSSGIYYTDVKDGAYQLSGKEPTREGYTFTGWTLNGQSGTFAAEAAVPFSSFDNEDKKATATANWEAIPTHNVTYTVNKPADSDDITYTAPGSATYYEGKTDIPVAAVPVAGTDYDSARYSFAGWTPSGVTVTDGKFTMPQNDVEFTGTFTKKKYTVTYSVTGAPSGYTAPAAAQYEVDSTVNVEATPDMSQYPGYQFTGWKRGGADASGSFTMPAENVTLTGEFEKLPYSVTYEVEGAPSGYTAPTDAKVYYVGDGVSVAAVPNIDGYTFEGWKKGDEVVTSFTMPAANVTLTGVFTKIPYHVTYTITGAPDGYSVPTDSKDYFVGDNVTAEDTPDMTSYPGYEFTGWKKGDEVVTSFTMPAAGVTLTGVFTKKSFTVSYSVTGTKPDGWNAPASHSEEFGADVTPKAVPEYDTARYTFEGWKKDGVLLTGTFSMPAENVTLTGVFTENDKITLKYDANDGVTGIIDSLTKSEYTKVTATIADLPDAITRTGYTFAGKWATNPDGTGHVYSVGAANQEFTENTTLYAVWNENTYALDYQDGGKTGAAIPDDESGLAYTVVKDGYALSSTEPTVAGYSFKSWLVNGTEYAKGETIPFSAFDNSSKTAVAVAQWNDWTYHVEYKPGTGPATVSNLPSDEQYYYGDLHLGSTVRISTQQPTADGYTFIGWSVAKKSGTVEIPADQLNDNTVNTILTDADFPDGTLTIVATAVWEAIPEPTYTVTYKVTSSDPAASAYTLPTDSNAYHEGDTVTVADVLSVDGYTFTGWSYNGTTYGKDDTFTMPAANVELTGEFTKNPEPTYTLIFADNHESYNVVIDDFYNEMKDITGIPETAELTGEQLRNGYTLPTSGPDSYNYNFIGWSNAANKAYTSDEMIRKVTLADFGDDTTLTVYAKWKAKMIVTYSSGLTDEQTQTTQFVVDVYDVNGYIIKANNELNPPFHLDGYEIKTWEVAEGNDLIEILSMPSSGSGTEPNRNTSHPSVDLLEPGTKVRFHGNITFKAQWTESSPITLTYKANGGSPKSAVPNQEEPIEHRTGDLVTVQSGDSLKNGDQVFKYWSTSANDVTGSTHYKTGDKFTINEDTVLYAIYDDAPDSGSNEFTVTYDANGAKGTAPTDSNKYTGGETVTVAKMEGLTKEGCTFKEWNTKSNGTGTGYKGDGTDSFTMPESNVTLYAIWVDSNGNIVSPGTGESDMPLILALNVLVLSLLAGSFVMLRQFRARKEEA